MFSRAARNSDPKTRSHRPRRNCSRSSSQEITSPRSASAIAASNSCSCSGVTSKVSSSSWAKTVTIDPSVRGSPSRRTLPSTTFPVATFMMPMLLRHDGHYLLPEVAFVPEQPRASIRGKSLGFLLRTAWISDVLVPETQNHFIQTPPCAPGAAAGRFSFELSSFFRAPRYSAQATRCAAALAAPCGRSARAARARRDSSRSDP